MNAVATFLATTPNVRGVGTRELHWSRAFAWSRQRIGEQVVWHLHARSDRQMIAFDMAVKMFTPRHLAAAQLRHVRRMRAEMVRSLKSRGMW